MPIYTAPLQHLLFLDHLPAVQSCRHLQDRQLHIAQLRHGEAPQGALVSGEVGPVRRAVVGRDQPAENMAGKCGFNGSWIYGKIHHFQSKNSLFRLGYFQYVM